MKKTTVFLIFFIFVNLSALSALAPVKQKYFFVCQYKNIKRKFILFLPEDFENFTQEQKSKVSLILMLHGADGSAQGFVFDTKDFYKSANSRNYAVANEKAGNSCIFTNNKKIISIFWAN